MPGRSQLWRSPVRLVWAVLLSLSFLSPWVPLAPAASAGMSCCKRSAAHSCCKKKTPDGPALEGLPPCGNACKVPVSSVAPAFVKAMAPRRLASFVVEEREVHAASGVRVAAAVGLCDLYQRPPPLHA